MKITVAGASLNQTPIDWEGNKQNIIYAIEYARLHGVEILCLPELCITGYGCEDLFLSDWLYEKAFKKLLEIKEYCYDITVAVGLPIKFEGKNYNCACLIHNKEIKGFYAKQFLANDGIHYETRWFHPWKWISVYNFAIGNGVTVPLGDVIFEVNGVKIGFEICEDSWRKEERPGYKHKMRGVDVILNPSASHFSFGKTNIRHDELVMKGSKEFECTYVFSNLLGNEAGRAIYDGEILIAQRGKLLSRNKLCSFQNFNVQVAEIDILDHNNSTGTTPIAPFISKEMEFAAILPLALFDYMRKSKSKGFVLSLSGGADSSCNAVMVALMVKRGIEELGTEYFLRKSGFEELVNNKVLTEKEITHHLLTCVYQATKNSSELTFISAKNLAESIGANFYDWKIDKEVNAYTYEIENALNRKLDWKTDDLALQNIQARSRSPIIWMLTNIKNALLIATSNRSEGDVGYCTMDGDTSGSISPIAGVDKNFINHWLLWAQNELGFKGLESVNNLEPSAELRPLETLQKDEDDLMPYFILNEIEKLAIRQWKSPLEVFQILKDANLESEALLKAHINKFFRLWSRNQWKRERLAPSFHVDEHNVDPRTWCRFPILSGGFEEELALIH
ncbi:MAG: NAD(+) synthase [Cytophagales bacterium]